MEDFSFDTERRSDQDYGIQAVSFSDATLREDDFRVSRIEVGSRQIARGQLNTGFLRELSEGRRELQLRQDLSGKNRRIRLGEGAHFLSIRLSSSARKQLAQAIKAEYLKRQKTRLLSDGEPGPSAIPSLAQKALPLAGGFSPSKALTEFWIRGVNSYRPENIANGPIETSRSNFQLQSEFAKQLTAIISTIGQQRRYSARKEAALTTRGRFQTQLQTELCDRFQIVPDECSSFLSLLYEELTSGVSDGIQIRGNWGNIAMDENKDLLFILSEAQFIEDPDFTQSEDVE